MKRVFYLLKGISVFLVLLCTYGSSFNAKIIFDVTESQGGDVVLSEEEINGGYSYHKEHLEIVNLLNIEINDIEVIDSKSYVLCGRINGSGYSYYPYVAYYENNQLVFQKTFDDYGIGVFKDMLIENDKIVLIGNYDERDVSVICLFELDLDGKITKSIKFGANRDSYGYKVLSLEYEYMIVGATYASEFMGCQNQGTKSMVVGRVDKEDFSDNYLVSFGNETMDFHDAVTDNEAIFILATVNGLGYFSDRGRTKFLVLIKMDHYVDSPEYISLFGSEVVKTSKMFIYQDHVCFMEVEHSHQVGLVSYSKDLEFINMDIYTDNHLPSGISDFCVDSNNKEMALSLYSKYNNKLYERRIIFDKDFNEYFNEEFIHQIDDVVKKYKYSNHVFFYVMKNRDYKVYTDIFLKKIDDDIYINGTPATLNKEEDSNLDSYGVKKELYEATLGDISVNYYHESEVELKTNITPFSTYDKGISLEFNAKGYLNGEEIENGYKVNNEGQYLLELLSTDGKKESIYFTVGSLTIDYNNIEVIGSEKQTEATYKRISEETIEKEHKVQISDAITVTKNNYNYYYLIISLVLGSGLGLLLIRGKRNKNA